MVTKIPKIRYHLLILGFFWVIAAFSNLYADAINDLALKQKLKLSNSNKKKGTVTKQASKKILVVIDAGHGGQDPGAIGLSGIKEKNIVLDVAQRLCMLINSTSQMQAKLTRNNDVFIPLADRVKFARKVHANIFISIHADAFTDHAVDGSSVFILSESGASSVAAKWLANTQNNSDFVGGLMMRPKNPTVNKILLDMAQNYTIAKSNKLGQSVLNQIQEISALHSQQVERAGFAVLKAPDIPSILVETAFISNPKEEKRLNTNIFRQKIANAIYLGILGYLKL